MHQPSRQGDRRQVSVLFTDMVGYTAIVEDLGEERAVAFTKMIYDTLTAVVRARGGTVRSFAGDSIMAVFGLPEAMEDSALRACRAALAIHVEFAARAADLERRFGVRPQLRVGVSSGTAVMASVEGDNSELTAVGKTVNLASRIQSLAPSGGCLICDDTRRLVEWLVETEFHGEHDIKGVSGDQKLWVLKSIAESATRFDASVAQGLSTYVGREDELGVFFDALEKAESQLSVVDLVAEPGLGKTRLVYEFLNSPQARDKLMLTGHCAADGQQIPFFPFLEITRRSFRIDDSDSPDRIAEKLSKGLRAAHLYSDENLGLLMNLLGLEPPEGALDGLDGVLIGLRTRDLFPALLAHNCRNALVILQIEDIHWIDTASEGLLRRLITEARQPNLMVILPRRPEYIPDWNDSPAVTSLPLQPLAQDAIGSIVRARLGVESVPPALVQQVAERAGGNPLFGEEIVAYLSNEGALRVNDGEVWFDAERGRSGLPVNMQGLLTARVDRLDEADRRLLQAAAVVGRRFDPGLLTGVAEGSVDIAASLQRLQALDVVYREGDTSDFRFKHVLLRDTVYQSLLSERKSALHLGIAKAIEARSAARLSDSADTLAYHYAQTDRDDLAFRYAALAGARSLGVYSLEEANRYFASALALYERDPDCASEQAFADMLADYAMCANISLRVNRMLELADRVENFLKQQGDSASHVRFLHHYLCCLIWNGRYLDALAVERQLSAMAQRVGDAPSLIYALVSEMAVSCYTGHLPRETFEARRAEAEALLADSDDAYLHNFFHAHIGWNAVCRGQAQAAQAAADRMIELGTQKNDPRALGYGTGMKALIALASDNYQMAFDISQEARRLSRVPFETTIAETAYYAPLIPLEKPGAAQEVQAYCDRCSERGWTLFMSTTFTMLGIAKVIDGRIAEGLKHIEDSIAQREREGFKVGADWYRLFLCDVYLAILAGEGDASPAVMLRNIGALSKVILFGGRDITRMVETVRANPMFDPEGHQIGRAEMILGLLCKIKKKKDRARAHLEEARRIVAPSGSSGMLTRIETALADLDA
ncbi:adenylate/guanylate cyclase domain-containing protein [Sulfitobacter sp. HNIBRBA3233]|uniref:ATP-binding protein n=1 Tax=Sulfitobacter marinivivus TaxID=3158558 RepID=UPI0032DF3CFD